MALCSREELVKERVVDDADDGDAADGEADRDAAHGEACEGEGVAVSPAAQRLRQLGENGAHRGQSSSCPGVESRQCQLEQLGLRWTVPQGTHINRVNDPCRRIAQRVLLAGRVRLLADELVFRVGRPDLLSNKLLDALVRLGHKLRVCGDRDGEVQTDRTEGRQQECVRSPGARGAGARRPGVSSSHRHGKLQRQVRRTSTEFFFSSTPIWLANRLAEPSLMSLPACKQQEAQRSDGGEI